MSPSARIVGVVMQIEKRGEFFKVAGKLIYGWALVCEQKNASGDWVPYVDTQNDHVPEDVMVDAALDFAKNSRVGKDMHAGDKVANVPFVYVVTKASTSLGIETKKTGMLIGWEPDDPSLVEAVERGERTGFSIGGYVHESDTSIGKVAKTGSREGRENEEKPARVFRRFEITEISLVDMPAMEGATIGYFKNADGTSRRVIARRTAKRGSFDIPVTITVTNAADVEKQIADGERVVREVIARNTTRKSPPSITTRKVEPTMNEEQLKAKIAELEAELTSLKEKSAEDKDDEAEKRFVVLTPDQHAHYAKLHGSDALAFVSKSDSERTAIVKAALEADPVVYTTKTGIEIRKSQGALMKQLAEDNDATVAELEKARRANDDSILKARAKETLGHLAGTTEGHIELLKAIDKIADEKHRADALAAIKAADAIMASKGIVAGANEDAAVTTAPAEAFNGLVEAAMKASNITKGAATEAVLNTAEGKTAYAALRKSIVHRNR